MNRNHLKQFKQALQKAEELFPGFELRVFNRIVGKKWN